MIYAVITMVIKEQEMNNFITECKKLRPLVLSEKGCLMYDYTQEFISTGIQEVVDKNRVTLYEQWDSIEALNIHNSMPYMEEFMNKVKPMRESVTARFGERIF